MFEVDTTAPSDVSPSEPRSRQGVRRVGPLNPDHLVAALRSAAEAMTSDRDVRDLEALLAGLVAAAVDTVPGAVGAGITRASDGELYSSHATSDKIGKLDRAQADLGEGPCIIAATERPDAVIVAADDLTGADALTWPRFAPLAVAAGYRSMISVPLSLNITNRLALNFYATRARALDASAKATASLFGLHAAVLLHSAERDAQLNRALETRDVIGRAKGILHLLVRSSQDTNMKLVDVARWLTGEADQRRERNRRDNPPPTVTETSNG